MPRENFISKFNQLDRARVHALHDEKNRYETMFWKRHGSCNLQRQQLIHNWAIFLAANLSKSWGAWELQQKKLRVVFLLLWFVFQVHGQREEKVINGKFNVDVTKYHSLIFICLQKTSVDLIFCRFDYELIFGMCLLSLLIVISCISAAF